MEIIAVYYVIINLAAFVIYGADKFFAKKSMRRVPEKTLLGLALLGGAFGAFAGMYTFRHKTRHLSFKILVPAFAVLHLLIIAFLANGGEIPDWALEAKL